MRSTVLLLYVARAARGFGDGFAIIVLPAYLVAIGFDPVAVGIVVLMIGGWRSGADA